VCLILCILMLFSFISTANADTVFEDIKVELGLEIGNEAEDYEDKGLTIEKGRFVKYRIKVTNSGTSSHNDILLLMNRPNYMEYVADSTVIQNESYSYPISDVDNYSPLELGYKILSLSAGEELVIDTQFQIVVDEEIKDEVMKETCNIIAGNAISLFDVDNKIADIGIPSIIGSDHEAYDFNMLTWSLEYDDSNFCLGIIIDYEGEVIDMEGLLDY